MRVARLLLATALVLSAAASRADGGVCIIPDLVQGRPTEVPVEDISKGFCGAARINKKIVRLEEVAIRKLNGPVVCSSSGTDCWKRVEYYLTENDVFPYVVIFKGPKVS